jgi:hypothetical protein
MHVQLGFFHTPLRSRGASLRSRLSFFHVVVKQVTPDTLYINCA